MMTTNRPMVIQNAVSTLLSAVAACNSADGVSPWFIAAALPTRIAQGAVIRTPTINKVRKIAYAISSHGLKKLNELVAAVNKPKVAPIPYRIGVAAKIVRPAPNSVLIAVTLFVRVTRRTNNRVPVDAPTPVNMERMCKNLKIEDTFMYLESPF